VTAGEQLRLHYSGSRPKFAIDIYRQGQSIAPDWVMRVPDQGWFDGNPGQDFPLKPGSVDWDGPFKDIPVPIDWAPGVYIAMFSEADDDSGTGRTGPVETTSDGRDSKALFCHSQRFPGSTDPL
jgi:hypothetical protein